MKSVVRPELSTAAAGPSQAPTAAVDNSAPLSNHPEPTYKSGKAVQTTGTTSPFQSLKSPVEPQDLNKASNIPRQQSTLGTPSTSKTELRFGFNPLSMIAVSAAGSIIGGLGDLWCIFGAANHT
jgi:hypothetical protein